MMQRREIRPTSRRAREEQANKERNQAIEKFKELEIVEAAATRYDCTIAETKLNKLVVEIWWCWKPTLNAESKGWRGANGIVEDEREKPRAKPGNIMTFNLTLISFLSRLHASAILFCNTIKTLNFHVVAVSRSFADFQIEFPSTKYIDVPKSLCGNFNWKLS